MDTTTKKITWRDIPQARLAVWTLIAGEFAIFGGLIVMYILNRMKYESWGEMAQHTNVIAGTVNTFVLLTSSYFVVKAHEAAVHRNKEKIKMWIWLTILCALIFLGIKTYEYSHEIMHGFTLPGKHLLAEGKNVETMYWGFYYTMTGLHGLHVVAGALALFFVMRGVTKTGKNYHRIEAAGLYWHMVDIIWIFLFPLIYLIH